MTNIKRFFKDESGATAIEYGLLAALISIAALTMMTDAGTALNEVFTSVEGCSGQRNSCCCSIRLGLIKLGRSALQSGLFFARSGVANRLTLG